MLVLIINGRENRSKNQTPRFLRFCQNVKVTLKIYNTLGQEVATLAEGIQEAGYKSVEFNANSLPSGVYMYRVTSGRFEDVKKMMIVK